MTLASRSLTGLLSTALSGVLLSLPVAATGAAPPAACMPLLQDFDTAIKLKVRQLASITATADRVLSNPQCAAADRRRVGRLAALAHGEASLRMEADTAGDAKRLAVLEAGTRYGQPWQLMAAIGDLKRQVTASNGQPDFGGASLAYQRALVDMDLLRAANQQVPPEVAERIERLAGQMRMLAPTFTSGRDLMGRNTRNIMVEAIPVPVQFEYNSESMTELGRKYAEEMLEVLNERRRPKVRLTGHTDPRGTDPHNDALSERRAAALKAYLVSRGYPADNVRTEGVGRRQPAPITEGDKLTEEQINQILRRVELKLE